MSSVEGATWMPLEIEVVFYGVKSFLEYGSSFFIIEMSGVKSL
jgi:hypothetical protein